MQGIFVERLFGTVAPRRMVAGSCANWCGSLPEFLKHIGMADWRIGGNERAAIRFKSGISGVTHSSVILCPGDCTMAIIAARSHFLLQSACQPSPAAGTQQRRHACANTYLVRRYMWSLGASRVCTPSDRGTARTAIANCECSRCAHADFHARMSRARSDVDSDSASNLDHVLSYEDQAPQSWLGSAQAAPANSPRASPAAPSNAHGMKAIVEEVEGGEGPAPDEESPLVAAAVDDKVATGACLHL